MTAACHAGKRQARDTTQAVKSDSLGCVLPLTETDTTHQPLSDKNNNNKNLNPPSIYERTPTMTMAQPSLVETSGKVRTIRKRPGFLWKMGLRAGVLSVAPRIRGGGFFDDLAAHSNCSVKTLFLDSSCHFSCSFGRLTSVHHHPWLPGCSV